MSKLMKRGKLPIGKGKLIMRHGPVPCVDDPSLTPSIVIDRLENRAGRLEWAVFSTHVHGVAYIRQYPHLEEFEVYCKWGPDKQYEVTTTRPSYSSALAVAMRWAKGEPA